MGVKYTDESPSAQADEGRYAVCKGFLGAFDGKFIILTKGTCACGGGKSHIGLTETRDVPLKTLVEGEKLWSDAKTAIRSCIETEKTAISPIRIVSKVYFIRPAGVFSCRT